MLRQFGSQPAVPIAVTTTAETVLATVNVGSTNGAQVQVTLEGLVVLTTGTATTGVTVRLRRGTDATGTVVATTGVETAIGAAGSTDPYPIQAVDTPGDVGGQSYALTVQQAAATGNGSVTFASLNAAVG